MRCRVEISFGLESPEQAKAVAGALGVDDGSFVETSVEGCTLSATAEAENPKSLMHTLDDYLSCASVAIKASSRPSASAPRRAPRGP